MLVGAACLGLFLAYLCGERLALDRARRRVPRRVCVTGTRGKSSVTRLIAAALREQGEVVLAKTTGSRPMLILPDGTERDIPRAGPPSLLEQKRLLRLAARLGARTLVAEMMSIRPESLAVESRRLLKAGLVAVTNVRLDHLDLMGRTRAEVAASLTAAFPDGGEIFFPAEEREPAFDRAAAERGARLLPLPALGHPGRPAPTLPYPEFEANIRLALGVASRLGVAEEVARRGMAGVKPDLGSLKVWRVETGTPPQKVWLASAFAANDPASSLEAVGRVLDIIPAREPRLAAVLNLREDRGDRSRQWLDTLFQGRLAAFERLFVVGGHARAFVRIAAKGRAGGRPSIHLLSGASPEVITASAAGAAGDGGIIIGLGNMGGLGEGLVAYWSRIGRAHGH